MPTVRILPSGVEFEVLAGESVAAAAWRQGVAWPTKCFGQAECMVCFVRMVDGELSTVPPADEELDAMRLLLPRRLRSPLTRLGCRLVLTGEGVVLEKKGVHRPETADGDAPAGQPAAGSLG